MKGGRRKVSSSLAFCPSLEGGKEYRRKTCWRGDDDGGGVRAARLRVVGDASGEKDERRGVGNVSGKRGRGLPAWCFCTWKDSGKVQDLRE